MRVRGLRGFRLLLTIAVLFAAVRSAAQEPEKDTPQGKQPPAEGSWIETSAELLDENSRSSDVLLVSWTDKAVVRHKRADVKVENGRCYVRVGARADLVAISGKGAGRLELLAAAAHERQHSWCLQGTERCCGSNRVVNQCMVDWDCGSNVFGYNPNCNR